MQSVYAQSFNFRQFISSSDRRRYDHVGSVLSCDEYTLISAVPEKDLFPETDTALVEVGEVVIYTKKQGQWIFSQTIKSPHGQEFARFGQSVAQYKNMLAIGAPLYSKLQDGKMLQKQVGQVYLYKKNLVSGEWEYDTTLTAPAPKTESWFGFAISWSHNHLCISAPLEDQKVDYAGAVYVYKMENNKWHFTQKLTSSVITVGEKFGNTLVASKNFLIISSPSCDIRQKDGLVKQAGKIEIFRYQQEKYSLQQVLYAPISEDGAGFGTALTAYRDQLLVTAPASMVEEKGIHYKNSGFVYHYRCNDSGMYVLTQKMHAPDPEANELFGSTATISGPFMAISSPVKTVGGNVLYSGVVYLYKEKAQGDWILYKKLMLPEPVESSGFGKSIALWYNSIAIGTYREGRDEKGSFVFDAGAIYIFGD